MKKRGISLIVLVITIIVIVILATAVIVTVVQNNPIAKAKEAVLKNDVKDFATELNLALANEKLNDYNFEKESVNAYEIEDIKKYISSFTDKYYGKLCIEQGRLCFVGGNVTKEEKTMLEASGIQKGSYITKKEVEDIIAKKTNIPSDATTTDITQYIEGISPEQAEKFTIFKGNIYYRWEKTSLQEKKILHSLEFPCFMGDANGDGMLTDDDVTIIEYYSGFRDDIDYPDNLYYACDLSYDSYIESSDVSFLNGIIANLDDYSNAIDISMQDPERMTFVGMCIKIDRAYFIDEKYSTNDYRSIMEQIPALNKEEAKRIAICDGNAVLRYETLTDKEIGYIEEVGTSFLIGDGNFDGLVNQKDLDLLKEAANGSVELNSKQQKVLDINKDGTVNLNDANELEKYITGTIKYNNLF